MGMMRTVTWGIAAAAALALAPQAFAEDKTAEQKAAEKKAEAQQEYGEKTADAKQEYREQKAEADKDAAEAKAEAKEEGREVRASSDQPKNTSDAAADQTRQTTGSAAGTTSTHDTTTGGTTGTSAQGSGSGEQKISRHDNTDLIKKLYTSNRMEVEAAKIAQDNAQRDDVKQFAERMEKDHGEMADKLKELADARGATLDEDAAMKQHKAHLDQMENMQGARFDRHYTQMMKQHHEKSAKDVGDALKRAKQTGDHELAQLLENAKTTISEHRTLAKSLDTGKGQRQGRRGDTGSTRMQGTGTSGQGGSMNQGSGSTEQGRDTGSSK
jgi:putative membrane protein